MEHAVASEVVPSTAAGRRGRVARPESRPDLGDQVSFKTNTGQHAVGQVIQTIVEKRQETILLIERPEDGWRAFRLERDVTLLAKATSPVREAAVVFQSPD